MAFGSLEPEGGFAPMREINTTPLVDVMLVLLVVFMVTMPLMTQAIPVELPKVQGQAAEKPEKPLSVAVGAQGQLFWEGQPTTKEGLEQQLAQAAAGGRANELQLMADKQARYEQLAEVMAAAQRAGVKRLGFVSLPQP